MQLTIPTMAPASTPVLPRKHISPVYECSMCHERHDTEWAAEDCCPPEIYTIYLCPVCDADHDTEAEAMACCDATDDDIQEVFYQIPNGFLDTKSYVARFIAINSLTR